MPNLQRKKMSCKKRTPRAPRRRRHIYMPSEDDLPLSLFALLGQRTPRPKKKSTPRKKAVRAVAPPTPSAPTEVINSDDPAETAQILHNVDSKIGNFMQSGSFISSDEEEAEIFKAKTNKKPSPNQFFISDDSDDDYKVNTANSTSNFDASRPSTSAGTSTDNNPYNIDDDIMEFVDSVLDKANTSDDTNKQNSLKDMKSLEDFRKETEEMLRNASSLFDEIKAGRRAEPEPKQEEDSPTKVTVGACPICMESLASRPAAVTVCGHIFCKECIMLTAQNMKKCPTCRKAINSKKIHPIYF